MLTSVNAVTAHGFRTTAAGGTAAGNRAALQAALDTNQSVHIPRGTYPLEGPVLFKNAGQFVFGQGAFQTILQCSGDQNIFEANGRNYVGIRDLMMRGGDPLTGGYAFLVDGTPAQGATPIQAWGGVVENVFMDQMFSGVFVRDTNGLTVTNLSMQNMRGFFGIRAQAHNVNERVDVIQLQHVSYSASPIAIAAGRGDGLSVDGMVHSIYVSVCRFVVPWRGVVVENTPGLPFGQHASFLMADRLDVDFPRREAMIVTAIDRCRFTNSYFHGSQQEANVLLSGGVRDAKFSNSNITGAWKAGLFFDGNVLDLSGVEFDWNSQEAVGAHHGILLGNTAQDVRIIGGGGDGARTGFGIFRANPGTSVQLAAADAHRGVLGLRNF
jgi:hypothetical protein